MRLLLLVPALALASCGSPLTNVGGLTYNVPLAQCRTSTSSSGGTISCYDKNGNYTGDYTPMSEAQLAYFQAQQREEYNRARQGIAQSNANLQQTLNNGNALIQQGNQSLYNTMNAQPYSYQRSDGVWVYCNRTSSYTVSCRTN